ncbi:hypothetical protein K439DRAFT_1659141, partial [Ramaria rubella]
NGLPSGLVQVPQTQRDRAESQLDESKSLLSRLDRSFEIRLESRKEHEGTVLWIFLRKTSLDGVPV